jgi:hypothetical protein
MNDKPRIGRPPNEAGHTYKMVGVSGTQQEIDAVAYNLTPRERMEAMLEALEAFAIDDDGGRSTYSSRSGDL